MSEIREPQETGGIEQEVLAAYQRVFGMPEGEIVLRDLMTAGGMLSVAHVEGDSHSTAWNDGRRSIALHILARLRWPPIELTRLGNPLPRREAADEESDE